MLKPEQISRHFSLVPYGFKQGSLVPIARSSLGAEEGYHTQPALKDLDGFVCSSHQRLYILHHTPEPRKVFTDTSHFILGRIADFTKREVFELFARSRGGFIFPRP